MSRFIQEEVVNQAEQTTGRLFRLPRRQTLEDEFSMLLSSHLGRMRSGAYFESEVLLVTGKSGAGKTTEIESMIKDFNSEQIALPSGSNARLASCELDRKGNWKALGRKTLKSMGYPVSDKARLTQAEIWDRVFQQGEMQGCVGLNYDELQHILADKEGEALEEELDSFKSILKSKSWPFFLILSGVPTLEDYLPKFEQLFRKVTHVKFEDIDFDAEATTVHEMMSSYAIEAKLQIHDDLNSEEFIRRLVTAGAHRWGIVCEIVGKAIERAVGSHADTLTNDHFVEFWVSKTGMNALATPFNHENFDTVFRRDKPFHASVGC